MTYVDNFFNDNSIFRDMATSFKIEYFFKDIQDKSGQSSVAYINQMKLISTEIGNLLDELHSFYLTTNSNNNYQRYSRSELKKEILQIADQYNLYNQRLEVTFNKVIDWYKGVEIVRYINIDKTTLPFVLKYLYENKKKLNLEYYQKVMSTDKSVQLKLNFNQSNSKIVTKYQLITNQIIV